MEKPLILVAICNYNHSKYLEESIESIQNQTYSNLDICVIEDGSEDQENVIELVKNLSNSDKRVRLLVNKQNKGKWYCLNSAIESTSGTICSSHDADDISLKDRIEIQHNVMVHTKTMHN